MCGKAIHLGWLFNPGPHIRSKQIPENTVMPITKLKSKKK